MLLNKKEVRSVALWYAERDRGGKFKRVSAEFIHRADTALRLWILREVNNHPSIGITLK